MQAFERFEPCDAGGVCGVGAFDGREGFRVRVVPFAGEGILVVN